MNVPERSAPHLPEKARSAKSPCEGKAMDLADLIEPDRVVFAARASNKQQLLQDLASRAATLLNLDAQTIFAALQAREELGSTGLGNGFALPHARIEGLDRLFGMFARLQSANPFRFGRRQSCRSRVSPTHPASRWQRASRRPRFYLEVPARQGIRREIAQSAKRCRTVQPTLRSPAFVISSGYLTIPLRPGQPPNHALACAETGAKSSSVTAAISYWTFTPQPNGEAISLSIST